MTTQINSASPAAPPHSLPLGRLLVLACAGFVTLMTEVIPAGLLPQISTGLGVTDSLSGQLVTAYAAGSLLTAIPLMTLTQALPRRGLLLTALVGFIIVNAVTAVSDLYWLTLVARFFAGMFGGMVWALLVGYAARIAPPHLIGRAIAITGIGGPLAFSLGVPVGTFLGTVFGWRLAFGGMSVLAVALVLSAYIVLPDFPGQQRGKHVSIRHVLMLPGLVAILSTMLIFVVAHNILYTYIAPFLQPSGLTSRVDLVLLLFGVAGIIGLWLAGTFIDRHLRVMVLGSLLIFATIALVLAFATTSPSVILVAVVVWGGVVGAAPTLFQTAQVKAAGEATDMAQAMFVTAWNCGIAGGGLVGGLLLDHIGPASFPWAIFALLLVALWLATAAKHHGFVAAKP
jgi:predicted MFS family arabinose efflux permease